MLLASASRALLFVLGALAAGGCFQSVSQEHCNCPATLTETFHFVDDATGLAIAVEPAPDTDAFTVDGQWVHSECGAPVDAGPCSTWDVFDVFGPHTLHVTFDGYQPADVQANVARGLDCCGTPDHPYETTCA